jgi:DNA-binding Lrp family transcriptional regulator
MEFKKMPTAYVLLNTEIGAENQVLKALRKIEGVKEAHNLWGVYDIIANIKADSLEGLRYIITKRIGQIGRINSKLTMIITDNPLLSLEEQVFFGQNPIETAFVH